MIIFKLNRRRERRFCLIPGKDDSTRVIIIMLIQFCTTALIQYHLIL